MKYRIKQSEIVRRKRLAVACCFVGLSIGMLLIYVAFNKDIAKFAVLGGTTFALMALACTMGIVSMSKQLRRSEIAVTPDELILPTERGVFHVPWRCISRIQLEIDSHSAPSAKLIIEGHPTVRLAGFENMETLVGEILCHVPRDKVEEPRLRTRQRA